MTSPLEQKIKITGPVVVTANRVGDGAVVYFDAYGRWTTALEGAVVTSNTETARKLVQAAIADDLRAVGPYVAPVKLTRDGALRPGNLRELIRLHGPTIDLPMTPGNGGVTPEKPAADMIRSGYLLSQPDHAQT
jgi:Protein of unknown function (DUF2849)